MSDPNWFSWTRRRWLSRLPLLGVAAGAPLAASTAPASSLPPAAASPGARLYNLRDFGAVGDGRALDTAALQAAIDRCHHEHGGTVVVPAGVFRIGTTELKSNVTLYLVAGAKLLGSADGRDYHAAGAIPLSGDATLRDGNVALLFAANADNITVAGPGTIDGQGAQFRRGPHGEPPPSGRGGDHRPHLLLFYRCRHLSVHGLRLYSSAYHCLRVIQSHYLRFTGLHIHNRVNSNNDGFHFISCGNAHVSQCDVESQDDACALFGSCQRITVSDSTFSTRWSVFRFGGGQASDIVVSNCVVYQAYGCPIKIQCGPGSRMENLSFANLIMHNVTGPISVGLGAPPPRRPRTGTPTPPAEPQRAPGVVRGLAFANITATVVVPEPIPFLPDRDTPVRSAYRPGEVRSCLALNGVGDWFLEDIRLSGVRVRYPGGGTAAEGANRAVPAWAGEYFESGVLPAYGLYARNVRGLSLADVRFDLTARDQRPAVVFDQVEDAMASALAVAGDNGMESALRLHNCRAVYFDAPRLLAPAPIFARIEGAASAGITLDGGALGPSGRELAFAEGAPPSAARLRA